MNANIPHKYWFLNQRLIMGEPASNLPNYVSVPVIVHAVQSRPGLSLMFHALTDFGAQYSGVPLHALWHREPCGNDEYKPEQLQAWSCFDDDPRVIVYDYMAARSVSVRIDGRMVPGVYAFTVYWPKSAYTAQSSQYKEAHVMLLENGQIAAMPNNRIVWHDASWVTKRFPAFRLQTIHPTQWIDPERATAPHDSGFVQGETRTGPGQSEAIHHDVSASSEP